jgi:hypothetical protein
VRHINSMSYARRRSNDRWTVAETNRFYHALACFGTDFTAIAKLFPGRDRCVALCACAALRVCACVAAWHA